MNWILSLAMFWIGGSFGFIFGAWWAAALGRERKMDNAAGYEQLPETKSQCRP